MYNSKQLCIMITLVKPIVQTLFKTVKRFKQRKKCDSAGENGAYVDIKFDHFWNFKVCA